MLVQVEECETCHRKRGEKHVATVPCPNLEELMSEEFNSGTCEATDGCTVEPDGHCEHGHQSWMLKLGVI